MKKYSLILFLCLSVAGFAQKSNVQSAADYFKKYNDIPKAKETIDLAAANESTANDPKMWYYRAKIYSAIALDSVLGKSNPDAPLIAVSSLINCIKTDKQKLYTDECYGFVGMSGIGLYNLAYTHYKNNDLERAEKMYLQIFDLLPYDKDSMLRKNSVTVDNLNKSLYVVANKAKDAEKSKMYLQRLIDAKFNDPTIYLSMSRIYLEQKDTAKALSYLETGKSLFENNMPIVEEEARLYILQGRVDELIGKLSRVLESAPTASLHYKRGKLYEKKKDYVKAEADFKKAIELKPDFVDANYDLGTMYFNQAAEMANAANTIKSNEEFNKAKENFEKKFKESQPYLEKAKELNPKKTDDDKELYKYTLQSLKQLYARTNQTEKYNEVKALMDQK
jgi:tetratricopeptide (TPR) repeat protein